MTERLAGRFYLVQATPKGLTSLHPPKSLSIICPTPLQPPCRYPHTPPPHPENAFPPAFRAFSSNTHARRPRPQSDTSFAPNPSHAPSNLTCNPKIPNFTRNSTRTHTSANEVSPRILRSHRLCLITLLCGAAQGRCEPSRGCCAASQELCEGSQVSCGVSQVSCGASQVSCGASQLRCEGLQRSCEGSRGRCQPSQVVCASSQVSCASSQPSCEGSQERYGGGEFCYCKQFGTGILCGAPRGHISTSHVKELENE